MSVRKHLGFFAVAGFCLLGSKCTSRQSEIDTIGKQTMVFTTELVSFGPRPPESANLEKVRSWIQTRLRSSNLEPKLQEFKAQTPLGVLKMTNIFASVPGKSPHTSEVLVLAHYDSKKFESFEFVGANDAASSVALLLVLADRIPKNHLPFDVTFVFVDGEEALKEWSHSDSLYGSRYYAKSIQDRSKVKSAIIVDMVGDKDLSLIRSSLSDAALMKSLESSLSDLNAKDVLDSHTSSVEDDHLPFAEIGIPVLHLMDFTYGGNETPGKFWHTERDRLENISEASLGLVGQSILLVLEKLSNH